MVCMVVVVTLAMSLGNLDPGEAAKYIAAHGAVTLYHAGGLIPTWHVLHSLWVKFPDASRSN